MDIQDDSEKFWQWGGNSGLMAAGRWEFSRLAHPAKYQDGREQLQGIDSAAMETIETLIHTDAGDENEAIGDRKSLD